jgi:hypothetical protein
MTALAAFPPSFGDVLQWLDVADWLPFVRIVAMVLWCCVAFYMAPAAFSVATGRRLRINDPFRFAIFIIALLQNGFALRGLLAQGDEDLLFGLHVLSAVIACYVVRLARAYGRGDHVD